MWKLKLYSSRHCARAAITVPLCDRAVAPVLLSDPNADRTGRVESEMATVSGSAFVRSGLGDLLARPALGLRFCSFSVTRLSYLLGGVGGRSFFGLPGASCTTTRPRATGFRSCSCTGFALVRTQWDDQVPAAD